MEALRGAQLRAGDALSSRRSAGVAGEGRVRAAALQRVPHRAASHAPAIVAAASTPVEPLMVRALRGDKVRCSATPRAARSTAATR